MKEKSKLLGLTVTGLCALALGQDAAAKGKEKSQAKEGEKKEALVKCQQSNSCAGSGGCHGYTIVEGKEVKNGCKGLNSCHNHVVTDATKKICQDLGGKVI